MRKYVITALFILLLAASAAMLLSPADTESILAENREPQAFPAFSAEGLMSGEFAAGFDDYVDDNVGFRSKLMNMSDKIQSAFGFTPEGLGEIVLTTKDVGTEESQESRLMLYQDKILEMFESNPETEQKYGAVLNEIRDALPDDVTMYSMLVPTQLEFMGGIYSAAEDSQKDAIDFVYSELEDIQCVDVYDKLRAASENEEDYLYFMTDHHWTMDGAYAGYTAFMEAADKEPYMKEDFPYRSSEPFYGQLYLKAKAQVQEQPQDIVNYYAVDEAHDFDIRMISETGEEYGENSTIFNTEFEGYQMFLGGDQPFIEITNRSIDEGKTLVVVKDSYANALLPWLINNYKTTVVIDPRSYNGKLPEVVEKYSADEVAVINYVFTTTFSDYCDILGATVEND